jgi:hypothetical protein
MRIEGWESRLADHVREAYGNPFRWGAHDCALWAARWVRDCTGNDFLSDWEGKYKSELGARRLMKRRGYESVADIADEHLVEIPVGLAKRGDLLLHPIDGGAGRVLRTPRVFRGRTRRDDAGYARLPEGLGRRLMPPAVPLVAAVAGAYLPGAIGLTGIFSTLAGAVVSTAINQDRQPRAGEEAQILRICGPEFGPPAGGAVFH